MGRGDATRAVRAATSLREHVTAMTKPRNRSSRREPRSVGESLRSVTASFGSRGRAIDLSERWATAVGEAIATHSRPERLDGGRLVVVVDDPAWASELRYHSSRILAALNDGPEAAEGSMTITELHFRVDPTR